MPGRGAGASEKLRRANPPGRAQKGPWAEAEVDSREKNPLECQLVREWVDLGPWAEKKSLC
jgi:hypothetical protein